MKQSLFLKIYIIPCLLMSPIFTMSCNSWFAIWMSMEFNLMAFIPFMIFTNKYYKNLSIKYFIIQAIGSSIIIFSSNSLMVLNPRLNFFINLFNYLMNLALLLKLGAAPMHSWFISLMKNLSWMNCLILSTWQKIIPMICLMYIYNKPILFITILFSVLTGAMMGLNHQSIRLILSYSSINHISWMLFNLMLSEMIWGLYFISYSLINTAIILIFNKNKIFYFNQILFINNIDPTKIFLLMNLLSLSGLPPMFGFLMKWFSLHYMTVTFSMIPILMIIMSAITFSFYIRLSITLMTINNSSHKLILTNKFMNFNPSMYMYIPISFFINLWIMSMWLF